MNNLKNKTLVSPFLICFIIISFSLFSCIANDDFEEIIEKDEFDTENVIKEVAKISAKSKSFIRRLKIKKRPNGLYRASVIVDGDSKVNSVTVEIEKKEGFIYKNRTYELEYFTTIEGEKYYSFSNIMFKSKDVENQEVNVNVTLYDAKRNPISRTGNICVLSGLAKVNLNRGPNIWFKPKSTMLRLSANIDDPESEVATVQLKASDLKGNSTIINTTPHNKNLILINFNQDGEISVESELTTILTLKDLYGDVLYVRKKKEFEKARYIEGLKREEI